MTPDPTCPRCGGPLRAPGLWSSDWRCEWHGGVLPYTVLPRVGPDAVRHVAERAGVPLWLPRPLPGTWVVSGVGYAGDERTGARATVLAASGPAPLGGPAELVVVAEEPGIGLGARYAGLDGPDPGAGFDAGPAHAKVEAAGHPTALWALASAADRAAYVGEAKGLWLWVVLWPAPAGVLLLEQICLDDLRERAVLASDLAYGALSPCLALAPESQPPAG